MMDKESHVLLHRCHFDDGLADVELVAGVQSILFSPFSVPLSFGKIADRCWKSEKDDDMPPKTRCRNLCSRMSRNLGCGELC